MGKRDLLAEAGYEDVTAFRNPDYEEAIIGVSHDNRAVYSYSKMVDCLKSDGMELDEAMEFIEYNTIRSLPCTEGSPVVVYDLIWL